MTFVARRPGPPLDRSVRLLWWYEGPAPAHAVERMLPTAALQLVINLRGATMLVGQGPGPGPLERVGAAVLGGPCAEPYVIPTAQQTACAGVSFHPGRAFPFLGGLPAAALQNAHISLDTLWGSAADRLVAQLAAAAAPAAGLDTLERALQHRLRAGPAPHPAVATALAALSEGGYRYPIAWLAGEAAVSQQRLGQLFYDQVGLTPKQLARVLRFQAALRALGAPAAGGWAARALACGYADQAHLTRDFRAFTGLPPGAYVARWGQRVNHLPLDG